MKLATKSIGFELNFKQNTPNVDVKKVSALRGTAKTQSKQFLLLRDS